MSAAGAASAPQSGGIPAVPRTLYAATVPQRFHPPLGGESHADVCVVGGGFTGLSAALHLAEAGRSVILLEAQRIGWGASGRNGGQVHSGQRRDQIWLEKTVGRDDAAKLWELAEAAKDLVRARIARHRIPCEWTDGLISASHTTETLDGERRMVDHMASTYGVTSLSMLGRAEIETAIGTGRFVGGYRDASAGHLNPLALAVGLATAATAAGAQIHEGSEVVGIDTGSNGRRLVRTCGGSVEADQVVLAGNGYLKDIAPGVEARVLPINNYVVATAPLGAERLIPGRECVADSRFVVRYWRQTADGRLVFGGGESYTRRLRDDVAGLVRPYLAEVYPDLADVPIDYAWGGTLAVTRHRMPFVRRVAPGLYAGCGYSGQGVATATFAGKMLADAINGDTGTLDVFARLPVPAFPGGTLLRTPLLVLAMTWFALRDRM
ncbi:NAD(P)/FAD-dependent oxidoreductase [Amorphus sp. MBR-141]